MKITPFLYPLSALLAVAPLAQADISLGAPEVPVSQPGTYHVDLLASNAVRAVFKEIRSIPVVKLDAEPSSEEVAVFEVKQSIAHRRYDRMGDGELKQGKLFSISLASDVPGQDAELGGFIRGLQAGDEALLNIDHIYVFREEGNTNVRACTRFMKMQPQTVSTAPASAEPAPMPLPAAASSRQVFTQLTIEPDGQGGMRQMKIVEHRERTADGKESIRRFINDVEVDPQTNQPLPLSSAQPQPAPEASAAPAESSAEAAPSTEPQVIENPIPEPTADTAPPIPEPKPLPESDL